MTIAGGGGSFNPTSLTINASTRVTWTNVGTSRARVRDVNHSFLDSDDIQPGQSYSFTFCLPGTYQIEDQRGSAHATIVVTGTAPSPSPGTSPSPSPEHVAEPEPRHIAKPKPGTSPSPSPGTSPSPSPSTSPSPSPGTSPSPSPQPSCVPTGTASMSIAGGGGLFSPSSLTISCEYAGDVDQHRHQPGARARRKPQFPGQR